MESIVKMHISWTAGDGIRTDTRLTILDPDLIRLAESEDEAIEHFKAKAAALPDGFTAQWFEINKARYKWSPAKGTWAITRA